MNAGWSLEIALDANKKIPLWRQIADAITAAVQLRRLRPGERLPGARTLAERLGVHRHTVDAAYAELVSQGWVEGRQGSGTWVTLTLPQKEQVKKTKAAQPLEAKSGRRCEGFDWEPPASLPLLNWTPARPAKTLVMAGGQPDVRLIPAQALAQAYRRVLLRAGTKLLTYGDPRGLPALREQLAVMLTQTRGLFLDASQILVTRGSQMGLALVAQALIRPGDRVAVEAMGYQPAWGALRAAGAELVPIPVDREGICVDRVAQEIAGKGLRAVYVTPHHQYPTTVLMSAARRLALLEVARRGRVAILEDDYDHEFQYEGRPVLPLAASDREGVVIYIGTLSKVLAPGLRVGFVVGSTRWIEGLAARRVLWDRQGDQVAEAALAELMESGELARHVRKMKRIYAERRGVLGDLLREQLGDALRFTLPPGGMAIWAEVLSAAGVSAQDWAKQGEAAGVSFAEGTRFTFDGSAAPFVRLGFACLELSEIAEAVGRMVKARG